VAHDADHGGWAPLRVAAFRRLWSAQFVSNVGSWMQTVAAQWTMNTLTGSALLLSAIPAAASIPVLVLVVPAGALGDLLNRRRLIVGSQALMLAAAVALAVLAAADALTPWVLIGLLLVVGIGLAISAPTWQTLQPELVPADERSDAIALGSVNQNLARAVGPAIGGALLAVTSAAVVFLANAVSFVAVLAAVATTAIPGRPRSSLPREHAVAAVRAGGRYVENSPALLAVIARSIAFTFFAGAIWALLPLVARNRLGLGSAGYGLLLGCVGVGALLAATFAPALKRRLLGRATYAISCAIVAAGAVVLALGTSVVPDVIALVAAGGAWILGLGLLGAAYQSQLPSWVKARAFAYYLVAFQGAIGIGSLCLGAVAQATSVRTAFLVIAGALAVAAVATWPLPLPSGAARELMAEPLPLPQHDDVTEDAPVIVTVDFALAPGKADAFLDLAADLRHARRRTGAVHWHLHRDLADPDLFEEVFVVGSWQDHERQHARQERDDQALLDRIDALLRPGRPRTARHAIGIRPERG
jgi:MFS family permease